MADEEQLAVLRQGSDAWNAWRKQNRDALVDLSEADLSKAQLVGVNLSSADLFRANLTMAHLTMASLISADLNEANLTGAHLSEASLLWADLFEANLSGADLSNADLAGANLTRADVSKANLSGGHLTRAQLVRTNFTGANLMGCRVYGISAWDLRLEGAEQKNLIITPAGEAEISVDNLEVAQFIYLLLNNDRIRHVIDTITSKVVLILGRFTPERKVVLDALREVLRRRDYTPVLFDFDKPASKDLTGTVQTLANMARFVIADLTDPSSLPHELAMVVPTTRVPVQPVLLEGQREYAMFADLRLYPWVLEPYRYASPERLITDLRERVILPAEAKAIELRGVSPPT
jgi:Pentapeptide repeats (8 copies)